MKLRIKLIILIIFIISASQVYCEATPSLEGRMVLAPKDSLVIEVLKDDVGIPSTFYKHLRFDSGEEATINIGINTKVVPYYAKLKYLLNPILRKTPYYVVSLGVNYVDGEDLEIDRAMDSLGQRMNYGVGVGISIGKLEVEILYGKYNYQTARKIETESENGYSSTKLSFNCKYIF